MIVVISPSLEFALVIILFPKMLSCYYTSAGGVVMFSRALRLYKREGIRVNVLCPEVRSVFEA